MTEFRTRPDIASDLIHFTKGDSGRAAFDTFRAIVGECRLSGGTGFIKGGYSCVCFTEAPLGELAEVFWNSRSEEDWRYMPFGVLVPKIWVFAHGGRPVIYQPLDEFELLPAAIRYRHVTYNPTADPVIDFTWEREWRIRTNELALNPGSVQLVVPSDDHKRELESDHARAQDAKINEYSSGGGSDAAELQREPFPWRVIVLDDIRPDWHYVDGPPPGWGRPRMDS